MSNQNLLIEHCKDRVGAKNLANELADLLGVNVDAAYRRMRGVTALTFDEIQKICLHFNISFDSIINYSGKLVPFQFNGMFGSKFSMHAYLENIEIEPGDELKFYSISLKEFQEIQESFNNGLYNLKNTILND